jgi:hypothetical protein
VSVEIRLLEERACWSPGETVRAEVRWEVPVPPEGVEVRLLWETRGRGDREEGVAAQVDLPAPAALGRESVQLSLPEGPWSYEGRILQIAWLVDAILWPSGEQARAELVLSPTGHALQPLLEADDEDTADAKL